MNVLGFKNLTHLFCLQNNNFTLCIFNLIFYRINSVNKIFLLNFAKYLSNIQLTVNLFL